MSSKEVYNVLKVLDICGICILRHLNVRCNELDDIQRSYKNRDIELPADQNENGCNEPDIKRSKSNVCIECLGLFQNDYLDTIAKKMVETMDLSSYECDTIYTSISVPILIQMRELALWIHLLKQLPGKISETSVPSITIKETFKYIMNTKLCKLTGKTLESRQNGILVNVFFEHDAELLEIKRLDAIAPSSMRNNSNRKRYAPVMTRALFEKNFYPENLDLDKCIDHLPVPPSTLSTPLKLVKCCIVGPTIFVAGRYRKLSRDLSQTPWILDGKRVKSNSLQEIIAREVAPYFGINIDTNSEKIVFMSSGREDIDVRCLGKGRPFVLEIQDAKKIVLPTRDAAKIESQIDESELVSVQHLQIARRDDIIHIKSGEEEKRKFYRAHCILQEPATADFMQKLDIPDGFLIQQKTPLRVLHRRPLLTRPRRIFSVKGYLGKDNPRNVILDVVTQAGTYVKELVHGEFGRTSPSIASIIGQEIDIIALDVNAIELNWPPEINNKLPLK